MRSSSHKSPERFTIASSKIRKFGKTFVNLAKMNFPDEEGQVYPRNDEDTQQAMLAARSILLSGGTQGAAQAAAFAILEAAEGQKGTLFGGHKRFETKQAKQLAEIMASVALLSLTKGAEGEHNYGGDESVAIMPNPTCTDIELSMTGTDTHVTEDTRYKPAPPGKPPLPPSHRRVSTATHSLGMPPPTPPRSSTFQTFQTHFQRHQQHPNLASRSEDSTLTNLFDQINMTSTYDDAKMYTTAKTRAALNRAALKTHQTSQAQTILHPASAYNATRDEGRRTNDDEGSVVDSILSLSTFELYEDFGKVEDGSKRQYETSFSTERNDETYRVSGFVEAEPRPGTEYFPFLAERSRMAKLTHSIDRPSTRTISICIPCFNEEAASLKRSINSLQNQALPSGVRLEIMVAMDGTQQVSKSMNTYLEKLFGITTKRKAKNNPFEVLPDANTVIIQAENSQTKPNSPNTMISLVLKRTNRRKVNSQMWWLRSHARDVQCEFAFATDCGIVFDSGCIPTMIERMDRQPNLSALTGYQRVMTAQMQGDSRFECIVDPWGFFLRILQSYDFELSQSTTKSALDDIGFIPVLPGPCSLFRYKHFAGVMHEYLSLTTKQPEQANDISRIVLGNVQLAEDRFPPVLLTFRDKEDCEEEGVIRPHTGFEHDAVFYFEAEKPLGQLVKQRRRWINGSYIAVFWVLRESWIKNADHNLFTRVAAFTMLLLEFIQGLFVRFVVPATIACGICFMCTIIPPIYFEDTKAVTETLDDFTKADPMLFGIGCAAAAFYLFVFAVFLIMHVPRAIPTRQNSGQITWNTDKKSAYRPFLFFLAFILNAVVVGMFVYVGYGVYSTLGWRDAPNYLRALNILIAVPYIVAFMDGIVNTKGCPSFRTIWNLLWMSPVYFISSLWFYVWFPAYASVRISDLSWGNREGGHEEATDNFIVLSRAYYGRAAAATILLSNTMSAAMVIGVIHVVPSFLTIVLFTLLASNVILHVTNLLDMFFRALRKIWTVIVGYKPIDPRKIGEDESSTDSTEESA